MKKTMKSKEKPEPSVFFNILKLFALVFAGLALFCSLMMDLERPETIPGGRSTVLDSLESLDSIISGSEETETPEEEEKSAPEKRLGVKATKVNGGRLYAMVKRLYETGVLPSQLPRAYPKKLKPLPVVKDEKVLFHFLHASAENGHSYAQCLMTTNLTDATSQLSLAFLKIVNSQHRITDFTSFVSMPAKEGLLMQLHWINSDFVRMSEAVQSMLNVAVQEKINRKRSRAWEPMWLNLNVEEIHALEKALAMLESCVKKGDSKLQRARNLHDALIRKVEYHRVEDAESVFYRNRNKFIIYAMDGHAICEGYAQAYGFLLHLAGVPSMPAAGEIFSDEPEPRSLGYHAWNLVKVDEKQGWRHVDVTWDDPDRPDAEISYKFFMITTEEIERIGHRDCGKWSYLPAELVNSEKK
ncbi:MAG: hypothetical protein E7032_08150 [Akkermansiaceae bacterium]|nr:hypothetical protein [Akkermansiaceae bacterium]